MSSVSYVYLPDDVQALQKNVGDGQNICGADWSAPTLEPVRKRLKKHHMAAERQRCVYCHEEILDEHGMHWNIDHVVPKSLAPEFTYFPENLALCCWGCNQAKGKIDPRMKGALRKSSYPSKSQNYLAFHPYFDEWGEHLYKDAETKLFVPRNDSKKGASLIETCNLQRLATRKAQLAMEAKESRSIEKVRELVAAGGGKLVEDVIQALDDFTGSKDEFADLARQIVSSHAEATG